MFGITQKDVDMCEKIHAAGLKAAEAYELWRSGTLGEPLKSEIDKYERSLKRDAMLAERSKP